MEDEIKKLQEVQPLIYDIDKTVDAVLKKYPNFGKKIAQKWAKARKQFKNKKLSLYEKAFQEARSREIGQQMNTVPELLPQTPEETLVQPQPPEQPPLTPQTPVSLETQQPVSDPGPQIAPLEKDLSAASAFEAGIGQAGGVVGSVNKFAETYIKGVLGEWLPKDKIGKTGSERIKEWARTVENESNFDRKAMDEMAWYNPQKFALTAIETIPQLGVFGASTAINPALGFAVMGAAEGGEAIDRIEQYEKATGEKVPDGVKYTAPIVVGAINGLLERTGIEQVLKGFKLPGNIRRRLADIAISMAVEGLTEGTQSAIQSVVESGYSREANTLMEYIANAGDQLEQDWQQILQEAYAGVAGGGGVSTISNIAGAARESYIDRRELKDAQKSGERIGDAIFSENIGQRPQSDRARGMQEGDVIDLNGGLTDLQREAASQGIPVTNKKGEFISDNVLRRILSDRKKRTGKGKDNAGNLQGQAQQSPESGNKKPSIPAKEVKAFKDVAESTGTPLKTEDGKPLSERYFRYHIRQRLKKAGISDEVISEMTPAAINEVLKRRPDLAKPLPLPEPKKKTKSIDEIASPDAVKVRKKRAKRTFSDEDLRGYIANIGGIRTQDLKDREITNRADASIFFKIGRRDGQHIDELAESLINDGVIPEPPSAYNPSEWLIKLIREDAKTNLAGEQQQTEIDNREAEYYYNEYGKNAIIGDDIDFETFKKMWSAKIEPETVHTGALEKGDTFNIAGEQYRVTNETDDELTIKNGDTKTVDAIFGTLTIDKGSMNSRETDEKAKTVKITTKEVLNLLPNDFNKSKFKKQEGKYYKKLKDDIKDNGVKEPIVINTLGGKPISIFDGQHRLLIAEELGIKNIPVKFRETNAKPLARRNKALEEQRKRTKEQAKKGRGTTSKQLSNEDVFKYQNKYAEPYINKSKGWDNNYWRYRIENAGDILRELTGYLHNYVDRSYIFEKVNNLESFLKKLKGELHEDDQYKNVYKKDRENINILINAYEKQPTKNEEQERAKNLVLSVLKGDISGIEDGLAFFNEYRNGKKFISEIEKEKEKEQNKPKNLPNGIVNYIRSLKSNKKKAYASQYAKYKLGMIDKEPGTDLGAMAKQSVWFEVDKRLKPGYEEEFAAKQAREQGTDATKKQTMRTKLENRAKMEEKRRRDRARGQEDIFNKAERDKQKDLFNNNTSKETEDASFKKWFKGSKVKDAQGKPLLMVHGSNAKFDKFSKTTNGGFYFVQDDDYLSKILKEKGSETQYLTIQKIESSLGMPYSGIASAYGKYIYPAYLKIENPLRIDESTYNDLFKNKDFVKMVKESTGEEINDSEEFLDVITSFYHYDNVERKLIEFAKNNGYDGLIIKDNVEGNEYDAYVVFDKEQIRSATKNNIPKDLFKEPERGYNSRNQEIRYEKKDESVLQERQGRTYVPEGREGKRSKASTRKLQSGEFQRVERKYRTYKQLKFFAGKETINSPEDVAFIFKQLEQEAVEHFFVLHIPESGKPIVQHMSSGTYNSSLVEPKVFNDSINRFGTKEIYIVHNHPSGKVIASENDIQVYKKLKRIVEQRNVKMNEGIIIDTRNPVYGTFNNDIEKNREHSKTAKYTDKIKLNAITFSRKVYKYDPELKSVARPEDVAGYISAQRFSDGARAQLLSMDNANHVVGRFFISKPYDVNEMASLVTRSSGSRAIIVSNKDIEAGRELAMELEERDIELIDFITSNSDGSYTSARGAGIIRESKTDYVKEKDINDYNGSSVNYDKGGYGYINPSMIEMPELIEILNDLLAGRLPTVKENLGKALGLFSTAGYIKLRADLFKNPELAKRVLAHEIGHMIDWLPDKTLKRGNILGRMASLKGYMKHLLEESPDSPHKILTQKDRNRLRKEARKQLRRDFKKGVKEIIEEVTVEVPIFKEYNVSVDDILAVWKDVESREKNPDLHDFIATLSSEEKKAIMVEAMKGVINEKVQKEFTGRKQVGTEKVTKTTRTTIKPEEVTPENIRKRYRELLEREIDKRKLFTLERVTDQLKAITHIIKPFDSQADPEYTKYRYSSKELYADAISVLFNDPVLLRELAPDFYKGFFNYLERKPEVKRIYTEIMKRIEDPILKNENREKNIEKMLEKGEERAIKAAMMEKAGTMSFIAMIKRGLGNEAQRLTEQKKKKKKKGTYDPEKDPEIALEELAHVDGPVYNYLNELHHGIQKKMEALDISETEFGKFLFLKRVTGDRAELANPLGFTLKDALEHLSYLKDKMGKEEFDEATAALTELYKDGQILPRDKFEVMEAMADEFRRIREKHIISEMEKADMYSDDLMRRIKNDKTYVTFNVQHYMDKKYGAVASGHIYKQIGTFNDIINPFTATVMKDASLLRSIKRKRAAVLVEQQFKEITPNEIEKAKPIGKGDFARAPQGMELVTYLEKGKLRGYYIPKDIAAILNNSHNMGEGTLRMFYNGLQMLTAPLKSIFVSHNPFWAGRNLIRDVTGAATRIPEAGLLRMWYHTIKAMPDAARDVFLQQSSPMVKLLYKEGVLIVGREYHKRADQDGETLLSKIMADWRLQNKKNKNVWKRFVVPVWESLATLGQLTERAVKIGSANLIYKSRGKLGKQEIHMLRHLAGSPDFYNKGELFMLYNSLFLFSNAGIQGLRANVEAFKESPKLFSRQFRHSYMFKTMLYVILPKVAMYAAQIGLITYLLRMIWGDDGEEYGKAIEKAMNLESDYNKQNFNIIPVGFDSNGKAINLRLPLDFNGQIIGGIMWRMLQDDPDYISKFSSLFDYTMGGLPYSGLNPIIGLASDAIEYNAFGNIYESYFGNMVLPKSVADEGKYSPRALSYLSRYYYNKMGLRNLYRLDYAGPKEEKGKIEKIGKIPLIGPGFRSFVSITDRGVTDRLEKAAKTAKQEEARARNDAREQILNHINEIDRPTIEDMRNLYKSMKEDGFDVGRPTDFKRKYQMFAVARFSENKALMRALSRNNSKKVQRRILMEYFKTDDIDDIFRKRFLKKAKRDVFLKQKR